MIAQVPGRVPGRTAGRLPGRLRGRLRGAVAGAVCAVGAVLAHVLAGGTVDPGAFAVVVALSVLVGSRGLSGPVDPARTMALALLTQVAWHLAWILTAPGADASYGAAAMLATHLLAALATSVVSLGLEAELAHSCAALVAHVLPRPPVALAIPGAAPRRATHEHLPAPICSDHRGPLGLRGPPA